MKSKSSGSKVPPLLGYALKLLRESLGLNQRAAARKVGLSPVTLCSYEKGDLDLSPARLASLATAMGAPEERVDVAIFCTLILLPDSGLPRFAVEPSPEVRLRILAAAARVGRRAVETALDGLLRAAREAQAEEDRREAEALWKRLKRRSKVQFLALVEEAEEFRSWALAERLCAESARAAAHDPLRAIELAEVALHIAERVSGDEAWRCRLQGYAWAFLGNGFRVQGRLPEAEAAFAKAWALWDKGASVDPGFLDGSRLYDLHASLLRAQGQITSALQSLGEALAACRSDHGKGRILLKKAKALESMGDYGLAVSTLDEAEPLVAPLKETRDLCVLRFNRISLLCHLGHYEEAEASLPGLRILLAQLNKALDLVRLRWLEGRCAAGLERTTEAIAALSRVRTEFAERQMRYDEALVSLELASLYLKEQRPDMVKRLAQQMESVFQDQGLHQEARKALALFEQAVELETVTPELVQPMVDYLYRAQVNPNLRFELAA
jgi:transcriptional regulator with XRE-family HTH domain